MQPNLPVIALSAYILISVNANEAAQGLSPQNYMPPSCAMPSINPKIENVSIVLVESEAIVKANLEIGADANIATEFNERADRWEKETAIHSAPAATFLHKDYIAIIAKGVADKKTIVPLILKRLQTSGADWFFALENITGENPAKNSESFDDAFNAWCGWAKAQGLIEDTNEVLAA